MWWGEPEPGSPRAWRQYERLQERLAGRGDPTARDLAPLTASVALALVVGSVLLVWAYGQRGLLGLVLTAAAYIALLVRLVLWRGAVVRRRRGRYTAEEAARVTDSTLPKVLVNCLRRDGFRVELTSYEGRPRIVGVDLAGDDVDLTFRQESDASPDEEATVRRPVLRATDTQPVDSVLRLVAHLGDYERGTVLWASRQGGLHLLDGDLIRRWVGGEPLQTLLGLGARPPRRRSAS